MEEVFQHEPLSMSWCLDCHRNPEPNLRGKIDHMCKRHGVGKVLTSVLRNTVACYTDTDGEQESEELAEGQAMRLVTDDDEEDDDDAQDS